MTTRQLDLMAMASLSFSVSHKLRARQTSNIDELQTL